MGHTWGDCYNNPSNKDKKKRSFNKDKSEGNSPAKKPKGNYHANKDDDDVDMTGFSSGDDNSSKSKSISQNSSEILSFLLTNWIFSTYRLKTVSKAVLLMTQLPKLICLCFILRTSKMT